MLVVLAGVCLGLSILTKGLVGVVFTGIFAACLAVYRPAAIVRLAIALAIAGAIGLIVALRNARTTAAFAVYAPATVIFAILALLNISG